MSSLQLIGRWMVFRKATTVQVLAPRPHLLCLLVLATVCLRRVRRVKYLLLIKTGFPVSSLIAPVFSLLSPNIPSAPPVLLVPKTILFAFLTAQTLGFCLLFRGTGMVGKCFKHRCSFNTFRAFVLLGLILIVLAHIVFLCPILNFSSLVSCD